ncbi:type II secretion system protein F, partial [Pseudomonas sp. Pseusp97]
MSGALWLVVVSLVMAALGVLLAGMGWRARHHELVMRRLSGESVAASGSRVRSSHWLARRMRRAGIADMRRWTLTT